MKCHCCPWKTASPVAWRRILTCCPDVPPRLTWLHFLIFDKQIPSSGFALSGLLASHAYPRAASYVMTACSHDLLGTLHISRQCKVNMILPAWPNAETHKHIPPTAHTSEIQNALTNVLQVGCAVCIIQYLDSLVMSDHGQRFKSVVLVAILYL